MPLPSEDHRTSAINIPSGNGDSRVRGQGGNHFPPIAAPLRQFLLLGVRQAVVHHDAATLAEMSKGVGHISRHLLGPVIAIDEDQIKHPFGMASEPLVAGAALRAARARIDTHLDGQRDPVKRDVCLTADLQVGAILSSLRQVPQQVRPIHPLPLIRCGPAVLHNGRDFVVSGVDLR